MIHLPAFLFLQAALSPAEPSPRPIAQLVYTRWTAKEGAPSDIVHIAQTQDGYLWLATRSAVVRFDGVRFVRLAVRSDTIPNGGARRLLSARDGSLWIVWLNGLVSRLRGGHLVTYGEKDNLPVTGQLAESSTGTLVAATTKGISQFDAGKW